MKIKANKKVWLSIILLLVATLLSGCVHHNETGILIKEGIVIDLEYDIIFGGTFTDWRDEITFEDGTCLWVKYDSDLSSIELNKFGRYYFEKNYFEYDGCMYEFHKFIRVEYHNPKSNIKGSEKEWMIMKN